MIVHQRRLLNEARLLTHLRQTGLDIGVFAPENHNLNEKIKIFNKASVIIGTVGSSLFTAIFASNKCKLLACLVSETYLRLPEDNVQMLRSLAYFSLLPLIFVNSQSQDTAYGSALFITAPAIHSLKQEIERALCSS
jgi:capsular polysaccharide biosynthesis protein